MIQASEDLYTLARKVGSVLSQSGLSLATAESCTGGWVAQCITDVPGSSGWFDRGFITYSNEAKMELLEVDPAIIERHGAVSEATVRAMAAGALRHSRAQVAVAVSGIAGPAGGTPDKPVGTVWFAWQLGPVCEVRQVCCTGDRRAIRQQAVALALRGILDVCRK